MAVHVRDAVEGDARALSRLWSDQVTRPGADGVGDPPEVLVAKALLKIRDEELGRIIVAELDGQLVGCAFLRVGIVSPVDPCRVVHLSHVQVAPDAGRQGVGSALIEATVTWAELQGIESVLTAVPSSDREANRFLARLGMSLGGTLRIGTVAALRARLPHTPSAAVRQTGRKPGRTGRNVGQVVAARRSQRRARIRRVAP